MKQPAPPQVRVAALHHAPAYAIAGGLAAVVDIGGFHLLAPHLDSLALAAALSFGLAAVVNYLLSSTWVYRRGWRSLRRAGLFMLFACAGLGVNTGVTWWLAGALPVHPTLAKAGGVAVAFALNFLVNTHLVFGRGPPRRRPQASP